MQEQQPQEEAPQRQQPISDEIWLHTLAWIGREEVATTFALVNTRFSGLVDTLLQQRQWSLGELCIRRTENGNGVQVHSKKGKTTTALPIATTAPPMGVTGFEVLYIWYLNEQVINFLRRLHLLLSAGLVLELNIEPKERWSWTIIKQRIWPLLVNHITVLSNMDKERFVLLRKHISPTVLLDCVNLRSIYSLMLAKGPFIEDGAGHLIPIALVASTPEQDLFAWLHTARTDGRPKILAFFKWRDQRSLWIRLKKCVIHTFEEASSPVSFILRSPTHRRSRGENDMPLNYRTHERLPMAAAHSIEMVVRCPIAVGFREVPDWIMEHRTQWKNVVHISIGDKDIDTSLSSEPSHSAAEEN